MECDAGWVRVLFEAPTPVGYPIITHLNPLHHTNPTQVVDGQHKMPLTIPRDATVAQLRDTALASYLAWREDHVILPPPGPHHKRGPRPKPKVTSMGVLNNVGDGAAAPVVGTLRQLTPGVLGLGRKECWKGAFVFCVGGGLCV